MSRDIRWHLTEDDIGTEDEKHQDEDVLLAHLLVNTVVFLNTHWPQTAWPAAAREGYRVLVHVADKFAYAVGDMPADVPWDQLRVLYWMWRKDPEFGAIAWAIRHHQWRPSRPWLDEALVARGYDIAAWRASEVAS